MTFISGTNFILASSFFSLSPLPSPPPNSLASGGWEVLQAVRPIWLAKLGTDLMWRRAGRLGGGSGLGVREREGGVPVEVPVEMPTAGHGGSGNPTPVWQGKAQDRAWHFQGAGEPTQECGSPRKPGVPVNQEEKHSQLSAQQEEGTGGVSRRILLRGQSARVSPEPLILNMVALRGPLSL